MLLKQNPMILNILHKIDPETAHGLALKAMSFMPPLPRCRDDASLKTNAFGLSFENPVGLAAGMDKNAVAPKQFLQAGFGFVEIGTLTPKAQAGNPRPRLFRLTESEAVVNRMGFNNEGFAPALARLATLKGKIGVNIGANKDSLDRAGDYVAGIHAFKNVAQYFTVNISSPNTPGLRDLQSASALDELLARVMEANEGAKPVLLKLAPDLHLSDLDDAVKIALNRGISGFIMSNTTISRPVASSEAGGLSGKPLFDLSTRMLAETYIRVEGKVPLVGVGGISSAETAIEKFRAGATLIQLYSMLVYKGLPLVNEIKKGLAKHLEKNKMTLSELTGSGVQDWRLS
jgi:dihydroorotate dehydrogenase